MQNVMGMFLPLTEMVCYVQDIYHNISFVICTHMVDFCQPGHIFLCTYIAMYVALGINVCMYHIAGKLGGESLANFVNHP